MEKIDPRLQRSVWQRVYGREQGMTPQTRQKLQHCRRRSLKNARIYESLSGHNRYGDAFRQMARQSSEHAAMIGQMLEK